MTYTKFIYWLDDLVFKNFTEQSLRSNISMKEAQKAICLPLSANIPIGYVSPDAWNGYKICKRQLSWYFKSPQAGKYLVVSSFDLDEYQLKPECIIRSTKFKPKALPKKNNLKELLDSPVYNRLKPQEWDNFENEEEASRKKWLRVMGLGNMAFEDLFVWHCANHSNFLKPLYYIEEEGEKVPYSINKTTHICSACMEFYNIIGREFKKKYVVPCPGAVLFSGLAPNRYFEVISINTDFRNIISSNGGVPILGRILP
jgi:hypothetical protein